MIVISDDNNLIDFPINVSYGAAMFKEAHQILATRGVSSVGVVDATGKIKCYLKDEPTSYIHRYTYTGFLDMDFVNRYDCIFLMECNEFSVELVQVALHLWTGKKLVLVGSSWQDMIEYLDFPNTLDVYYEEVLNDNNLLELLQGVNRPLTLMLGHPHEEKLDRLRDGMLYYDEVMALIYMFSDRRELGNKNSDRNIFIMDGRYSKLGLFTMHDRVEKCLLYAKSKGFVPVASVKMSDSSFYSDFRGDDIWDKFYSQPEGCSIEEAMESANVFFCPGFYNASVMNSIMDEYIGDTKLLCERTRYKGELQKYIDERVEKFLPYPDKTLGVLARGTDYVNTKLPNHSIHASFDMIGKKIDEVITRRPELEYIYVATEDALYCERFKDRYGDKVSFTDQERYSIDNNELLYDYHNKRQDKRPGFDLGAEYAAAINLLSKCNSFIASGSCTGVGEALKENSGQYQEVYIFDLGRNPE